jgi:WD40 repeat protein/serine/threonine protein kinase
MKPSLHPPGESTDGPGEPVAPLVPDHKLIRQIGQGSYGEVWLARNVMGTYRAVKIVRRARFSDDHPFEREFAGLQRFEPVSRTHDSQVDILHIGRADGWFYYVMELADDEVTGPEIDPTNYRPKTLRAAHEGLVQYTAEETHEIGLALTTALEHLHQHGLVHRDIKPSNVIFVNGIPKLADIGLVSSVDATRSFVGTEGFVPPEGPGAATGDLYSLGKVLYELSTGRDRKEYPELPTSLAESPDRERLLELNAIIAKACRADPEDRYPGATAMKQDLLLMQSGKSVRRMQKLERRLLQIRKLGIAATIILLLSLGAFLFQRHQTTEAKRLAADNIRLAKESQRHADESQHHAEQSQRNAKESNDSVVRLLVANGNRLVDEGNLPEALPWLGAALKRVAGDPEREEMHRIRLDAVIRQMPRMTRMFRHEAGVTWSEFSPDGKRLATASKDRTARIWDVAAGLPLSPPLTHEGEVLSAVFSPDGTLLLTASKDKTARLWDAWTGAAIGAPMQHGNELSSAGFSPDGEMVLTIQSDGPALLWNARTQTELRRPEGMEAVATAAAFSSDSRLLAVAGSEGTITVWRIAEQTPALAPIRAGRSVNDLAFSPDGTKLLAGWGALNRFPGDRGRAALWSTDTGQLLVPEQLHESPVIIVEFSPDGRQFTTAQAEVRQTGQARIWDAETGAQIGPTLEQGSQIHTATFSLDGSRILTCSENATARVWDADTGAPLTPPLRHAKWVLHAAFSPDGLLLATASEDGLARVWNLATPDWPTQVFRGERHQEFAQIMLDARLSPDGKMVAGGFIGFGESSGMYLWDARTGERTFGYLEHPEGLVGQVEFSPDGGKLLLKNAEFAVKDVSVWQVATATRLFVISCPTNITHATFSPDGGEVLTVCADGTAAVWDSATGELVGPEMVHGEGIELWHGSFSPDGKRVVTAGATKDIQNGLVRVWDWRTAQPMLKEINQGRRVISATFSPDGQRIVTTSAGDQSVRVWNAESGEPETPLLFHGGTVIGAAFAPSGGTFVTYSLASFALVWDTESGHRLLPPLEHSARIRFAEYSRDGRLLVTASEDGSARLWDAGTGEYLAAYGPHHGPVRRATFHPHDSLILTASEDNAARFWRFGPLDWPAADVEALIHLLSAHEVDSTLSPAIISSDQLVAAFDHLRSRQPEWFEITGEQVLSWHRKQADLMALGRRWRSALWHLGALIEHEPENAALLVERANVLAEAERWPEAKQDFERLLELDPTENPQRLLYCALMADDLAGSQRAARAYLEGLLREENAIHRDSAVYVLTCAPGLLEDYDQVVRWAAANRDPFYNAMLYYRVGDFSRALAHFEVHDPVTQTRIPDVIYYFAMTLWQLGRTEEARQALNLGDAKLEQYRRYRVEFPQPWSHLAVCELARAEAKALIQEAAEPPANPPAQ